MLRHAITRWLYRVVLESPPAHALLLRMYLGSEAFHHRFPWFNKPELVADPALQRLMRQHFADEDNHAKYFTLALQMKGIEPEAPPVHLDYLVAMAAAFWDAKLLVGESLEALKDDPKLFTHHRNLFVQLAFKDLSEKRASSEFHIWRDLAKTRDPELYAILRRVVEDEDWHVHIFDEQVHKMMAHPEYGAELRVAYKELQAIAHKMAQLSGHRFISHCLKENLLTAAKPWEKKAMALLAWLQGLGAGQAPDATTAQLAAMSDPAAYQVAAAY